MQTPWRTARPLVLAVLAIALCATVPAHGQHFHFPSPRTFEPAPDPHTPWDFPSNAKVVRQWTAFYNAENLRAREDAHVVRDAYLGILERFAVGSFGEAIELGAELEFRLRADDRCYPREPLRILELLGEEAAGSVLPAAELHAVVWEHFLRHGRIARLDAQAEWTTDLARLHAKAASDRATGAREAADFLTRFADTLTGSGFYELLEIAAGKLDDALDLDPDHAAARHLRAVLLERQGFYRRALRDLEHLETLQPERQDVALRTAVLRIRLGDVEEGASLLDGLLAAAVDPDRPWVRVVAFEERIRVELEREDWQRAGELVARARAKYPQHTRLAALEADRIRRSTRRPDPSVSALLDDFAGDPGATPRLRYLQGPLEDLEAVRERLERAVAASLPALGRAVEVLQGEQPELYPIHCGGGRWKRLAAVPEHPPAAPVLPPAGLPGAVSRPGASPEAPAISAAALGHRETAPPVPSPELEEITRVYVDPETGEEIRLDEVMDLELRQIYVTPEGLGSETPRLERSRLRLVDDGRRQDIVTFEQGDIPFTAVVLLDGSGSMHGSKMRHALAGARELIAGMAPLDRARVVVAADRPRAVSPFLTTEDPSLDRLRERLAGSAADGGTALFEHLFLAVESLEGHHGRKVVIVLSDGYDLMSAVPMESVREAVRRSQAQLYWVRPVAVTVSEVDPRSLARRRELRHEEFVPITGWRPKGDTVQQISLLERTVRESGGDVIEITRDDEPAAAFARILQELRSQVALGYYPDPRRGDGSWRTVDVKDGRLGVRLRHVSGYFDD